MEIFFTILILILIVSVSDVITKFIHFHIPLPIIQIIIGALLAWPNFGLHIDFDPELFMVLLIPPLLFVDGWKTSTREFFQNWREIFLLVFGLVLVTIVSVAYLIHWLLPDIPLVIAFAVGAVISPTDAVVLSSIIGRNKIPSKMMSILEGEALMNDASGLVALKFAIAIAIGTMIFTVSTIIFEFFKIAIGGLLTGIVVTWMYSKSFRIMSRWSNNDLTTQMILMLLLPFASYLISEYIGFSGILSAVSAGMTISKAGVIRNAPLAMRLRSDNVWSILEFLFNGLVFIMLGLQLPGIWETFIIQSDLNPAINTSSLCIIILIIYVVLLLLRFTWLWFMQLCSKMFLKKFPLQFISYSFYDLCLASFAGVRGAITLAGVLSIPLFLTDNTPFSIRYQLVFITAGIIILSIVIGVIALPILLRTFKNGNMEMNVNEIQMAKAAMAEVAIISLNKMEERLSVDSEEILDPEIISEVASRVTDYLRRRINNQDKIEYNMLIEDLERRFRLTALHAERAELYHMRATKKISNETMRALLSDLDLMEVLLINKED
uniref:Na+/H+ antiporter n=1 Tax=Candidatus Aschnera chinzeii TaxID=1485666 RepID=A0AAT9G4N7_9ENTR|nr:MAG: Na+/H+ antiporter [Candidatus Aschnera chinzeii]